MTRISRSLVVLVSSAWLAAACAAPSGPAQDGRDDRFLVGGKTDTGGIAEGTPEARAILALVSSAGRDLMIDEIGLAERVADNILNVRTGDDGLSGTQDDVKLATLAQLDAIPYVGPKVFAALLTYAQNHGLVPGADGGVDGGAGGGADGGTGWGDAGAPDAARLEPCGATDDSDGDGTTDLRWEYLYDADGRSIADRARDTSGALVESDAYTYDSAGRMTSYTITWTDTTTSTDSKWARTYSYDAEGRLLVTAEDGDGDGRFENTTTTLAFDGNGKSTLQEQIDRNGVKTRIRIERDATGRMLKEEKDVSADGTVDSTRVCTYADSATGHQRVCTLTRPTGAPQVVTTVFRPDWQILSEKTEGRASLDRVDSYAYDDLGRLLSLISTNLDGTPRSTTTYLYECR